MATAFCAEQLVAQLVSHRGSRRRGLGRLGWEQREPGRDLCGRSEAGGWPGSPGRAGAKARSDGQSRALCPTGCSGRRRPTGSCCGGLRAVSGEGAVLLGSSG